MLKKCSYFQAGGVARLCSVKKSVLKNSSKFTGKHLCQSLFFNKVAGLSLQLKRDFAEEFSGEMRGRVRIGRPKQVWEKNLMFSCRSLLLTVKYLPDKKVSRSSSNSS